MRFHVERSLPPPSSCLGGATEEKEARVSELEVQETVGTLP